MVISGSILNLVYIQGALKGPKLRFGLVYREIKNPDKATAGVVMEIREI